MKPSSLVLGLAVAVVLATASAACSSPDDALRHSSSKEDSSEAPPGAPAGSNDPSDPRVEVLPDPLEGLPRGKAQLDTVCARGPQDKVTRALCSAPAIASVDDLQRALGLGFQDRSDNAQNGVNGNPAFALLGHSSSLVMREVSAINPRAFVFSPPPGRAVHINNFVVMGFARGEPFVEIAAEDANRRTLQFYIVKFELACEATKTCTPGDLLTPNVEKNWKSWTLYQDEDLKNTILDCRQCHQPGGPGTQPMLRMQEMRDPWTHWFRNDRPGGIALIKDFVTAHGDNEDYFGIPAAILQRADGRAMEDFVVGQGFQEQPNSFDSKRIEAEVMQSSAQQPMMNFPKGRSSTWQSLYDASASGQFIPPPYHDVKVTDPEKLGFAIGQYQMFATGKLPAANLPDIRRVFLESALEDLSMRPKAGATGKAILVQACAQCHTSRLDPSISRAKFDVTQIDTMSDAVKESAIARMKLPASDRLHMPPALFRTLPDEALQSAIDALK
jgi:mono/diheme cytochrome c family protein